MGPSECVGKGWGGGGGGGGRGGGGGGGGEYSNSVTSRLSKWLYREMLRESFMKV